MRLVHWPGGRERGDERVLAGHVETADSFLSRARGLMFRRSLPDDHVLAFRFDEPSDRLLHMLFVPFPIDAIWTVDGVVDHVARLRPWRGLGRGRADAIYELPAGAAEGVYAGDEVRLTA
ncbi:MAG: DUF192 domain-containing protein [Halobacteriaceae archaeon]